MTKIEIKIELQAQVDYLCDKVEYFANQGRVSRKSREFFGAKKPFVRLGPLYCVKVVFSYVVKGIKIKIAPEFRASRRLRFKDTKRIKSPEITGPRTIHVSMEYLSNLMLMNHGRTPER